MGVLAILFPLNIMVWTSLRKYQNTQMEKKDQRVKLTSEILNGIKVIKLFAWEHSFVERLNGLRLEEVTQIRAIQLLDGFVYFVWNVAPLFMTMASFISYVLIDPANNVLDTKIVFVSIALFNIIRVPLYTLPLGIASLLQAIISIRRIDEYLNLTDLDHLSVRKTWVKFNSWQLHRFFLNSGDSLWRCTSSYIIKRGII